MTNWHQPREVELDPILSLAKVFKDDPRPHKMDLLAGVLRQSDKIWLFNSVKLAQKVMLKEQIHKGYLPIEGFSSFTQSIAHLIWQTKQTSVGSLQTIGSTGALALCGRLLNELGCRTILIPTPSWPNHKKIFELSGLEIQNYAHLDNENDVCTKWMEELTRFKRQSVLVHACCHNPSGQDISRLDSDHLIDICKQQDHILIIDMAYQGLKNSLQEDSYLAQECLKKNVNFILCYSCAKNFTVYGERAGAFYINLFDKQLQENCMKYLVFLARSLYSNPPLHGSYVINYLLKDTKLFDLWQDELQQARLVLDYQRKALGNALISYGLTNLATMIAKQSGLFAYFPLSKKACDSLRINHAIYLPNEGRINLSALEPHKLEAFINSLKDHL
jgi:aspartate/tyrosine/aromatic aminotransferase